MARCEPGPSRPRRGGMGAMWGRWVAALAIGLAGCGGSSHPAADAGDDGPSGPPWWQPQVGQAKDWDIQLSAKPDDVDVSTPRLMYDLDLWALVPSPTKLTYSDGTSVMVPAGPLAGTIAQLHARTPSTVVICHVETGLLELLRPDAQKFPGYNADFKQIPDNPDAPVPGPVTGKPASGSVIGWSLGAADRRLLDTSAAGQRVWGAIMLKRFDLARQIGCDGIEPAHNDAGRYTSGFKVATEDTFAWYTAIAAQGHMRMLSTGMKGGDLVAGAVDTEAGNFDWLMIERCGEFGDCSAARPFTDLNKAVFAIDYNFDSGDDSMNPPTPPMPQIAATVCPVQVTSRIQDGLFKDVVLSRAVRTQCSPDPGPLPP